jgi:hypothetical protein
MATGKQGAPPRRPGKSARAASGRRKEGKRGRGLSQPAGQPEVRESDRSNLTGGGQYPASSTSWDLARGSAPRLRARDHSRSANDCEALSVAMRSDAIHSKSANQTFNAE